MLDDANRMARDGNTLRVGQVEWVLFAEDSPNPEDVQQGNIGDCYLLATLASLANSEQGKARLREIVTQHGDGYQVEFYRLNESQDGHLSVLRNSRLRVQVSRLAAHEHADFRSINGPEETLSGADAQAAIQQFGQEGNDTTGITDVVRSHRQGVTWPWAVEKAYAVVAGSYANIDGSWAAMPMLALTGQEPTQITTTDADQHAMDGSQIQTMYRRMREAFQAGNPVTISTKSLADMPPSVSNMWRVTAADANGITVTHPITTSETRTYAWGDLGEELDPNIVVEQPDGNLADLPPASLTPEQQRQIIDAVAAGRTVRVHVKSLLYTEDLNLVPDHEYTVLRMEDEDFEIRNPWGGYQPGRHIRVNEIGSYFKQSDMVLP
jgi:hypothetical protein